MASSRPTVTRRRASPEKRRPSIFWPFAVIVLPIMSLITKIEIEGAENLPEEGPYVVAPNHYSEIDPLIVAVAVWRLGRLPRFMAKASLFDVPVLGWALRATGMIPVARASSSASAKQTLSAAEQLVEHGRGVIVYPEGSLTRDPDLWPMRGKTGAVRLALDGGIPLIPMVHWGTQKIMPRYGKKISLWPLRKPVRVAFGPPLDLSEYAGRPIGPATLNAATDTLMDDLARLLGDLRGETPPEARWDPSSHGQNETGRLES